MYCADPLPFTLHKKCTNFHLSLLNFLRLTDSVPSLVMLLSGSVVRALDSGPRGREFDSQLVRYHQLWARCSHLRACVGARGLVVSVDS